MYLCAPILELWIVGIAEHCFEVQIACCSDHLLLVCCCLTWMNGKMHLQAVSVRDIGRFGSPCTLNVAFSAIGSINSG